jgi:hypothetical protein
VSDPRLPSSGTPNPPGATSVGGERKRNRKGRWLARAAVAAVVLLLLLLSRCGGDDDGAAQSAGASAGSSSAGSSSGSSSGASPSAGSPSAGSSSSAAPGSAAPAAPAGGVAAGQPGSLVTADGRSVLELAAGGGAGGLGTVTGQAVTGTAVRVLTVPADEGFWVGTSDADRVWVQLTGETGESPYQVAEGDSVDFTGTVVAHDAGFAGQVGVDEAGGAAQLTSQAQHVEAPRSELVLAD